MSRLCRPRSSGRSRCVRSRPCFRLHARLCVLGRALTGRSRALLQAFAGARRRPCFAFFLGKHGCWHRDGKSCVYMHKPGAWTAVPWTGQLDGPSRLTHPFLPPGRSDREPLRGRTHRAPVSAETARESARFQGTRPALLTDFRVASATPPLPSGRQQRRATFSTSSPLGVPGAGRSTPGTTTPGRRVPDRGPAGGRSRRRPSGRRAVRPSSRMTKARGPRSARDGTSGRVALIDAAPGRVALPGGTSDRTSSVWPFHDTTRAPFLSPSLSLASHTTVSL